MNSEMWRGAAAGASSAEGEGGESGWVRTQRGVLQVKAPVPQVIENVAEALPIPVDERHAGLRLRLAVAPCKTAFVPVSARARLL